jgi:hypothetical protein
MSIQSPVKKFSYVAVEAKTVEMTRALDRCLDIDNPLLRTCCYLEHGILVTDWDTDIEAQRRQKIRRDLIIVNEENSR